MSTEIESFYPKNRQQWRNWLKKNHAKVDAVWLICYKKESGKPSITWSDAVEEALCFGWIDSIRKTVDTEQFIQRFSRRKPRSTWSKINKDKVKRLVKDGLMTEAGLNAIAVAKKNGSWSILDEIDALTIPADLEAAFLKNKKAKEYFLNLSRSRKKLMLYNLMITKRPETRAKRIEAILNLVKEAATKKK